VAIYAGLGAAANDTSGTATSKALAGILTGVGEDMIVAVALGSTTSSVTSITDSKGHTYSLIKAQNGTGVRVELWQARKCGTQAGNVVTVNFSPATTVAIAANIYGRTSNYTPVTLTASGYQAAVLAQAGLVAYYKLDDPFGYATAVDSIGTNTGTNNGCFPNSKGGVSHCYHFDNLNSYISIPRSVSDDFSIEFWIRGFSGANFNAPAGTHYYEGWGLVNGEVAGVQNDFGISVAQDSGKNRIWAGTGNPDTMIGTPTSFETFNDAWHHVVFTRKKSTGALILYVDGSSVATGTGGTQSLTSPSSLTVGRLLPSGGFLYGQLDEVAIYNVVLAAADVSAHYAAVTASSTGAIPSQNTDSRSGSDQWPQSAVAVQDAIGWAVAAIGFACVSGDTFTAQLGTSRQSSIPAATAVGVALYDNSSPGVGTPRIETLLSTARQWATAGLELRLVDGAARPYVTCWPGNAPVMMGMVGLSSSIAITAVVNVAFTTTVSAASGFPPYTFAVQAGSLPTGLTLHSTTGVIDGTPTVTGVFTFTIRVTDAHAQIFDHQYTITVVASSGGGGSYTFAQ
jgi:hypothetical protein